MKLKSNILKILLLVLIMIQTSCLDEYIGGKESEQPSPLEVSFIIQNEILYSNLQQDSNDITAYTYSWTVDGIELGQENQLALEMIDLEGAHDVTLTVSDGKESDSYTLEVDFGYSESVYSEGDMLIFEKEVIDVFYEKQNEFELFKPGLPLSDYIIAENLEVIEGNEISTTTYSCSLSGSYTVRSGGYPTTFDKCFSEIGEHTEEIVKDDAGVILEIKLLVESQNQTGFRFNADYTEHGIYIGYKLELENREIYQIEFNPERDQNIENAFIMLSKNNDSIKIKSLGLSFVDNSKCNYTNNLQYQFNNQDQLNIDLAPWKSPWAGKLFVRNIDIVHACLSDPTHQDLRLFTSTQTTLKYHLEITQYSEVIINAISQDLSSKIDVQVFRNGIESPINENYTGSIFHKNLNVFLGTGVYEIYVNLESENTIPELYLELFAPESTLTFIE